MPGGVEKLIEIEDKGFLLAVHIYNEQVLSWIKSLKRCETWDEARAITFRLDPRATNNLNKTLLCGYLQGKFRARQEIAWIQKGKIINFGELTGEIKFSSHTFDEALQWFLSKKIISPEQFKRAQAIIKAISFSVQGLEEKGVILAVRDAIRRAMSEGLNFRQWVKYVSKIFDALGVTPLKPWHLETVYRTNLASVYGIAKREMIMEDDNVVSCEYFAIMDERVRNEHAAMNGFVAPKNDPIWDTWWPPNDYNCRCQALALSADSMERNRIKNSESVPEGAAGGVGEDFRQKPWSLDDMNRQIVGK